MGNVTAAGEFDTSADFGAGTVARRRTAPTRSPIASYTNAGTYRWSHVFHNEATYVRADATDAAGNVMVGTRANKDIQLGTTTIPAHQGVAAILDGATGRPRMVRAVAASTDYIAVEPTAADSQGNLVTAIDVQGDLDLGTGALAAGTGTDLALAGFAHDGGVAFFAQRYVANGTSQTGSYGPTLFARAIAVDANDRIAIVGSSNGGADLGKGPYTGSAGFVMVVQR